MVWVTLSPQVVEVCELDNGLCQARWVTYRYCVRLLIEIKRKWGCRGFRNDRVCRDSELTDGREALP
jgi:hypothetical protein